MVQCRVYSLVEGGPGGLERRRRGGDPVEQAGLLGRRHRAGVRGLSGTSMARGMERRGACVIGTPGRRGANRRRSLITATLESFYPSLLAVFT